MPGYQNSSHNTHHNASELGTHANIGWDSPIVRTSRSDVFGITLTLFDTSLTLDPTVALLNHNPMALTHHQFKCLLFVTTAAKQTITKA